MKMTYRPLMIAALLSTLSTAPAWADDSQSQPQEQTRARTQQRLDQPDMEQAQRAENQKRLEQRLNEGSSAAATGQKGGNGTGKGGSGQKGGGRMGGKAH
jgi:hypothetical protein